MKALYDVELVIPTLLDFCSRSMLCNGLVPANINLNLYSAIQI
jgi:hypothetical protein